MTSLGEPLNIVESPRFPCPKCGRRERMAVFVTVVQWECGHTRALPPITAFHRYSTRKSN